MTRDDDHSSRATRYLARWRAMNARQRWQCMVALWQLPLIRLSLRLFGFRKTQRMWADVALSQPGPCDPEQRIRLAHATADAIALAARRRWVRANCLPQSLLLVRMLRRHGIHPVLRLGARQSEAIGFEAHAWVELDGVEIGAGSLGHAPFVGPRAASSADH